MDFTVSHIQQLAELLREPEPEVLQGDDLASTKYEITATKNKNLATIKPQESPSNIEEFEELQAEEAEQIGKIGFGAESRKTPIYTMNYQQSVGAEDVFLQMGPKTPSSASCENLIVRVSMPDDKMENIDLSVDTTSVIIDSSQYHLRLSLPHTIDPDTSKANWDAYKQTLVLMLKLQREFDFINF